MNAIERLDQWVRLAKGSGYEVRHEYFGGTGGGVCEYDGKKFLFLDLALSTAEQLARLRLVLSEEGIQNGQDCGSSPENAKVAQVGFRSARK